MSGDTSPDALRAQVAVLRRLGPSGRFEAALEMSEAARAIAIEGERRRHPELSESEARGAVLTRLWGPFLASKLVR